MNLNNFWLWREPLEIDAGGWKVDLLLNSVELPL